MPVVSTVLDNFTRADTGPPPSANWTDKLLVPGGGPDTDGWAVVSNQAAQHGADAVICSDWWNADTFGPDCEVWITVAVFPVGGAHPIELWARLANPGVAGATDGYRIRCTAAGNPFQMYRVDNDVGTALGAGSTFATLANDTLTLSCQGASLTATVERGGSDVLVINRFDATYTAAGFFGFRGNDSSTRLSSFGGGNGGAAPVLGQPDGRRPSFGPF